jgi:hypothetical protein
MVHFRIPYLKILLHPTVLIRITVIAMMIAFAASCTTANKATQFFNEHPETGAKYCAEKYPVKDSLGEEETTYKPADNKNYQREIDGIEAAAKAIQKNFSDESVARSVDPGKPCPEVKPFQDEINNLISQVQNLQRAYKPCIPDTVYTEIPVYRENTARVTSQALEIDRLNKLLAKTETERDLYKDQSRTRLFWIIGLIALIGVGVFLKIKKII